MTIEKCDICKAEIDKKDNRVYVGTRHSLGSFSLCGDCGKPIKSFLKKHHLED